MLRPETLPVVSVTTNNNKDIKKKNTQQIYLCQSLNINLWWCKLLTPLPENTD